MANIIDTLHPKSNPSDNLYPNIKKANIPDGAIDMVKLSASVKNSIVSATPKIFDTEANILALTADGGLAVATDNGYVYIWDSDNSVYVSTGVLYQAIGISDGSVTTEKTDFAYSIYNLIDLSTKNNEKYWYNAGGVAALSGGNTPNYVCFKIDIHLYDYITTDHIDNNFSFLTDSDGNIISTLSNRNIDNSNNTYYYLYISYYNYASYVVVNDNLPSVPTISEYPYNTKYNYIINFSNTVTADNTDFVTAVKNIYNSSDLQDGHYFSGSVGNAVNTYSNADYACIKLSIKPNTYYSLSTGFATTFSYFANSSDLVLGKIKDLTTIKGAGQYAFKSPSTAYYLYLSFYKGNVDTSKLVIINGYTLGAYDYIDTNYGDIIAYNVDELEYKDYTMNYIYVSTAGDDSTGDGTKDNPYATIYYANSVITDNNINNRYTIIVANGTYTDLQTKYSGDTSTGIYKGVVAKSYVYYESETPETPSNTIIEWDGFTGFNEGELTDAISSTMCPFHITTAINTHIKGFTFNCKNLRYCLHIEQNIDSTWTVENCVFNWDGVPDVSAVDANRACVGMGGSLYQNGTFYRCEFYNIANGYLGLQWHDNAYGGTNTFAKGTIISIKECLFNNTTIQMRSGSGYTRNLPNIINVEMCGGIYRLYDGGSAGTPYWRVTLNGAFIDTLDMPQY